MVSKDEVDKQLKDLGFNLYGWGRAEVKELPHILLADEKIFECVNGIYEGGFALLLATDIRVVLVDKKPMSFLTIEDLRFDMINEIDYNHRMLGAYITIATGNKTMVFRSYNKERLRKLIGHVQHCMAETKKKQSSHVEDQSQHLEKINQQLQTYLITQYKQQQKWQEQMSNVQPEKLAEIPAPPPLEPSRELADYLFAQGLLDKYQQETGKELGVSFPLQSQPSSQPQPDPDPILSLPEPAKAATPKPDNQLDEMYAEGIQEVFGKQTSNSTNNNALSPAQPSTSTTDQGSGTWEVNPMRIAYSKLPMVLRNRNRKFGLRGLGRHYRQPYQPNPPQKEPEPAT